MNGFQCEHCEDSFENHDLLKSHREECPRLIFKKGPSFKSDLSKKQKKIRRKIIGSYEWALVQSNTNTSKRLKKRLMEKTPLVLEKEIQRLEMQVAFNDCPSDIDIKRLIAISNAYASVSEKGKSLNISKNISQTKAQLRKAKERARKKAVKEMNAKLRPDVEKTNDIMDIYFKSGERAVISGGLPSLGKRK